MLDTKQLIKDGQGCAEAFTNFFSLFHPWLAKDSPAVKAVPKQSFTLAASLRTRCPAERV